MKEKMSWFDTAGFASLAKSALTTAQKTIDRALDIEEANRKQAENLAVKTEAPKEKEIETSFFSSFGLGAVTPSSSISEEPKPKPSPKSSESSPMKTTTLNASGIWGEWGSSFYLPKSQSDELQDTKPTKPPSPKPTTSKSLSEISSKFSPAPTNLEDNPAVLLQPSGTKLFPEGAAVDNPEKPKPKGAPLKLGCKVNKTDASSKNNELTKPQLSPAFEEEDKDDSMTISTLLSELAPIQKPPSRTDLLKLADTLITVDLNKDDDDVSTVISTSPVLEELNMEDSCKSDNNSSLDTVIPNNSDDEDDDETEEELTVMEQRPKLSEINLVLPITPCFKNKPNDPSPTDYCFVDQSDDSNSNSPEKRQKEEELELVSSSTSMEIINKSDIIASETCKTDPSLPPNSCQSDTDVFSSPDSVVPIQEEPLSNLTSPHFPDIRVTVPVGESYLNVPIDMCDSDVTLISPSAEDAESTDSDKESSAGKNDTLYETESKELRECETSSSTSKTSNSSSSGSFVNCSIEDGDPCYVNREHSGSSIVASERSDNNRTETSGHTSGDDIETTTSSDIEIISPPNGENGGGHPTSPLKHIWVPRPHCRSKRSESPASDSSKDGLMPVVLENEELAVVSSRDTHMEIESLTKRLESQQELIEAREKRVMDLSKENVELHELNTHLRNRIRRMEETHSKDSEDVSKITKEFSQRLSQIESQLEKTSIERDAMSLELQALKKEQSSRMSVPEMEVVIEEKTQQVAELMQEGQKLSKQQLNLSNIIKKLRVKEKETETTLNSQKEKLEEQTTDLERLRKSLGAKDEQEKKHIDAIRQLTSKVAKQDDEIATLKSDLEDSTAKARSMKTTLDSAFKEMTEAQKKLAEKESEIKEATMSAEIVAKEGLQRELDQIQEQSRQEREALLGQVAELRNTLCEVEQQAWLRETSLKNDIAALQTRLEEADAKNDELIKSVSSTTRPLLRQLENLQSAHNSQSATWDKIERSLNERLASSQSQLATVKEQERLSSEKIADLNSKVSSLESRNKELSHEKIQLASQIEVLKAKLSLTEESKSRDAKASSAVKQKFAEELSALRKEKDDAVHQIELLKMELEQSKRENLDESLDDAQARSSPTLSLTMSHHSSVSEHFRPWGLDTGSEAAFDAGSRATPSYEQWWGGSATSMIETLQSQVKMKDGEIHHLQGEISRLERIRESMAEELGHTSMKMEELNDDINEMQSLRDDFKDTEQKYNTLLQMYGEKVEEAEELRLDLADVKAMYRNQIEELLKKS